MKKTWLLALLVGFSALSVSCTDDAGKSSSDDDITLPGVEDVTYALTCTNPSDCKLSLNQKESGIVFMQLNKTVDAGAPEAATGVNVSVAKEGSLFSLQGQTENSVVLVSDTTGMVALLITAGEQVGTDTLTYESGSETVKFPPVTVEVTVKEAQPDPDPDPDPDDKTTIDVTYSGTLTYGGEAAFDSGEVFLVEGKKCAEIAPTGLSASEIAKISASKLVASTDIDVLESAYDIEATELKNNAPTYAAVARVKSDGAFKAYGCIDDVTRDRNEFTIGLEDAFNDSSIDPGEETTLRYDGTYRLRSQFNALSLLPHAPKAEGQTVVLFKDMLAGDWIEFALDFLSNPEKEITSIISEQLLPLLLQGDWLKKLLTSAGLNMLTPELIQYCFESFGVNKIIEDLLKELTGQLSWWDTATSAVSMVNDLATNFTLDGSFVINSPSLDENEKISGIGHSYDSLLYNNAAFDKCYIGSDSGEKTKDGKQICAIPLSQLNTSASVRGTFTATFSGEYTLADVKDGKDAADVSPHALQLAYGKLIYEVLMQTVPLFIKPENGAPAPESLGRVLEYYIGYGLTTLWNKDEAHADNQITSSYCAAIGDYVLKLLEEKGASIYEVVNDFGAASITLACDQGVKALDKLINTQLEKLTVSNDKISFSSNDCKVFYTERSASATSTVWELSSFGQAQQWGDDTDNRCKWNVSVTTNEGESAKQKTIEGKYWAERVPD